MYPIWKNGEIMGNNEAVYSIYSSPLMFGDTAFSMMRTYNKKIFDLDDHINRTLTTCNILDIPTPTHSNLVKGHEDLLSECIKRFPEEEEWRLLHNIDRGILPMYREMLGDSGDSNTIITCFPLRHVLKGKSHLYKDGIHAIVSSQRAIPQDLLDAKLKTRSRQHYQVANLEIARQDPEAWALMLTPDGYVSEFTGANIFIVKDNKISTPKGTHCLRGITRERVIETLNVHEKDLTLYDLHTADHIFATCTPFGVVPVSRLSGCLYEPYIYAIEMWADITGVNYIKQAQKWDNDTLD